MNVSRRQFLRVTAAAAGAVQFRGCGRSDAAEPAPAIRVNHVGYPADGAKYALCAGADVRSVVARREGDDAVTLRVSTVAAPAELGAFTVADLSAIRDAGTYTLSAPGHAATPFVVAASPYRAAVASALDYFRAQRCGHPTIGHHAPCHLDDGRRSDNGTHQDASGGWHDACDLRKWVDATIYGVIGLARVLEALSDAHPDRAAAIDEIRWGNAYFLKMQRPDGAVMRWCGGDGGNHYTDNKPGTKDDRVLDVHAAELFGQFLFVAAQALVARLLATADAPYAKACGDAAARCMAWCATRSPEACLSIATGATAASLMYTIDRTPERAAAAAGYAAKLAQLQAADGWFYNKRGGEEPYRDAQHGDAPLLALCDLLECLPDHVDAGRWRDALGRHVQHLESMAARSAFGIVPYGVYHGDDPGGGRRLGDRWYRWFMRPRGETADSEWWVGNSTHVGTVGVGLRRAARCLPAPRLGALGQRQLDWLLGANPFDASLVTGIGRNQPRLYRAGTFKPPTPPILGGVMNGIGGDDLDRPALHDGSWETCEYWTPNVAYFHWALGLSHP